MHLRQLFFTLCFIIYMEILPVYCQTNYNRINPSFGDCAIKAAADDLCTHFTHIDRNITDHSINIQRLTNYITKLKDNCVLMFCGCSDASEVYAFLMPLVYKFHNEGIPLDKLPRIKAFDVSPEIIDIAKKGRINISNAGVNYINSQYGNFNFFTDKAEIVKYPNDNLQYLEQKLGSKIVNSYQFNPELLKKVEFYTSDMLTEFKNLSSDVYHIIWDRNVPRYNTDVYQRQAGKALDENLKPGSLVIVGFCDEFNPMDPSNKKFIVDIEKEGYAKCPRLPFTDELFNGKFCHDQTISPYNLVYKKLERKPTYYYLYEQI